MIYMTAVSAHTKQKIRKVERPKKIHRGTKSELSDPCSIPETLSGLRRGMVGPIIPQKMLIINLKINSRNQIGKLAFFPSAKVN